jgi:S-DNA-T family DNA segregation ATPase FtsK/SpoIIIE
MTVEHAPQLDDERLQYQLQLQAEQVQKLLSQSGMPVSVTAGTASGRSFRYTLHSHVANGLQRLRGLKDDLKQALGVESLRLFNESGEWQLQILRPFEPAVPLLDLLAITPYLPPATAVLGLTASGKPMVHTFSTEPKPHVLITGHEEAGKTTLLRTIAASLALTSKQGQIQLLAINPLSANRQRQQAHDAALQPLSYLPHMLTDVATRQSEITELLLFLVREMNHRIEHEFVYPRMVILIDQAATVMEHGGRTVKQAIQTLAQRGAQSGFHLVLSTRRPDAESFGPHLMTNLQARFTGQLNLEKATDGQSAAAEVEATTLLGEGDFLAVNDERNLRFQAAYIDNYDLHMSLAKIYRQRPILLAQPLDQRVKLEQKTKNNLAKEQQFAFLDDLVPRG